MSATQASSSGISKFAVFRSVSHRIRRLCATLQEVSCEFSPPPASASCSLLPAFAQRGTPPPPTDRTKASYMSAAEVADAIAKLPKDRANSSVRVFTLAPYNVNIEHRQPMAQGASVHAETSELFYVIEGSATMLTGGKLVGETGKDHRGRRRAEVRQRRLADGAVRRQSSIHRHQEPDHDSFVAPAEREIGRLATGVRMRIWHSPALFIASLPCPVARANSRTRPSATRDSARH